MKIFHVMWSTLVLVLVIGLGMAIADAAGGPDVISVSIANGSTVNPNDSPNAALVTGTASPGTERVTVAIKDRSNNTWWAPASACPPDGGHPTCADGSFAGAWSKHDARLDDGGGRINYSFLADLPDGDYNLGVKAYDGAGATGQVVWHRFTVAVGDPFEPENEFDEQLAIVPSAPLAGDEQNAGAATFTGAYAGASEVLVGVYNRDVGRWMDPQGTALPSKQRFPARLSPKDGVVRFVSEYTLTMALPAGSYAYGVDAMSPDGSSVGSVWTAFTVVGCDAQCANNITLSTLADGTVFNSDNVCFAAQSNAAEIRLAVRNDDTGQWLQDAFPPYLGDTWAQFNNMTTLIQAGLGDYNSCYNDAPLNLPVGNYHMGVRTYDGLGNEGPNEWISFTVVP